MVQERYDETLALLRRHGGLFPFVQDLLNICDSSALIFSYFNKPFLANTKQNVLAAYEIRSIIRQRQRNDYSISSPLLDQLRKTEHEHICVSIFRTNRGVYTIFSDFDRTEIIGAFFSNEEPKEPPFYSHLFLNGQLISRDR
ncbi:MAG TPA: hypothetical protein VGN00_05450 [Puia sp.]|jgi:hypothetical protein